MKHWIAVISRAHARIAADFEFLQVCHGKAGPLRQTRAGDEVFIYCPRSEINAGEILKTVEFQCVFNNDDVYQVEQFPGFKPFRKDVTFNRKFQPVVLKEVIGLELTANPHWGMLARRGFFEISEHDAELLRLGMRGLG
ncbi:EVE domain-containing protein [Rosenbergiella sp. S61]|uniref:EVE domain-containing protein n=1 Tax=Rosenbergiella gaditana TaxID=2726987 RepID=A0ABS5SVY4_9GAMM|nr:EVE domain-containing protein [Rosenbergiella gaditana]MBT0723618.1 EVE domain-containing protein [Rosenbergiella gaditana]